MVKPKMNNRFVIFLTSLSIAMQHKKREKVIEFFDIYGPELHGKPEWSQWFRMFTCHLL
jgi:hypothetical protein